MFGITKVKLAPYSAQFPLLRQTTARICQITPLRSVKLQNGEKPLELRVMKRRILNVQNVSFEWTTPFMLVCRCSPPIGRRHPVTVGTVVWVPEHNLGSAALRYVCLLGVFPTDWFPSASVLSPVLSRILRLPRISSYRRLFIDTFASDEEKHYAWMKRGRGKAAVGEIIHIAEDKCIFSTRLIPCTHFQPPCTSTSFYIPQSSRIIPPSSTSSSSSSSPSLPPPVPPGWGKTIEGSFTPFGTHRAALLFFQSGLWQWLARSR